MEKEFEDFKNNLKTEDEKKGFNFLCQFYNHEITPIELYNQIMNEEI